MLGKEIIEESTIWASKHVYDQVHGLYNTHLSYARSDLSSTWFVNRSFDELLDSTCQVLYKCIPQHDFALLQAKLVCESQKANKSSENARRLLVSFTPLNLLHSFTLKQNQILNISTIQTEESKINPFQWWLLVNCKHTYAEGKPLPPDHTAPQTHFWTGRALFWATAKAV